MWGEARADQRFAVNTLFHLSPLTGGEVDDLSLHYPYFPEEVSTLDSVARVKETIKRKQLDGNVNRKTSDPPHD